MSKTYCSYHYFAPSLISYCDAFQHPSHHRRAVAVLRLINQVVRGHHQHQWQRRDWRQNWYLSPSLTQTIVLAWGDLMVQHSSRKFRKGMLVTWLSSNTQYKISTLNSSTLGVTFTKLGRNFFDPDCSSIKTNAGHKHYHNIRECEINSGPLQKKAISASWLDDFCNADGEQT